MASTNQKNNKEAELEKKLSEIASKRSEENSSALAQRLQLPFSDLKNLPIDPEALVILEEDVSRTSQCIVISKSGSKLTVAVVDPENPETLKALGSLKASGYSAKVIVTTPVALNHVLARYKDIKPHEIFELGAIEISEDDLKKFGEEIKDLNDIKNKVTSLSATKLLEILVAGALKIGASDIHFEPESGNIRLRYRLDGVLNDVTTVTEVDYAKLLSRVKVLSKLKLNIHKSPQDGRFTIKEAGIDIEVRVSVLPSEFGETIVMRLLDPRTIKTSLEELGMREDLLGLIKEQLGRSNGAILTTGPTGSGKTTTLYAFIRALNNTGTKIITIEDPIEYHLQGISQTQVDPKKGYDFAHGLRAIVRQDPDIILVGEIRDMETADVALQAALTGHLVLSTIHTNDASGTIPRLIDLGIKPQIIAPAINMAMAQRLVRKLCKKCKVSDKIPGDSLTKIKESLGPLKDKLKVPNINESTEIFFPGKCKDCNETGYQGRVGVYEAFVTTKDMERLILKSPAISDIRDLAVSEGMITMLQDAYLKLLEGVTSLEEIDRILG